jgi:hypothetical protein
MSMDTPDLLSLEDVVVAVYAAMDDALIEAGIKCHRGRLVARPGPPPEVDDREILCLALVQELLGFESDHRFHLWLQANPTMRELFPRQLSRPNFAERRALLTPLLERLCGVFCDMLEGETPPFSSSTAIPWTSVVLSAQGRKSALGASPEPDGVTR